MKGVCSIFIGAWCENYDTSVNKCVTNTCSSFHFLLRTCCSGSAYKGHRKATGSRVFFFMNFNLKSELTLF